MWSYGDIGTSGFFFYNNIQASMSGDGFSFSGGSGDGLSCGGNDLGTSGFFFSFNCYNYC